MTLKDHNEKIEFLKQYLPYKNEWYKRLSDNQIVAIYCKQVNKNKSVQFHETEEYTQLSFDFNGTINDNPKVLRKVVMNRKFC